MQPIMIILYLLSFITVADSGLLVAAQSCPPLELIYGSSFDVNSVWMITKSNLQLVQLRSLRDLALLEAIS